MDGIFVGQVAALGSPLTAPADRAAADVWLRQFRASDAAWATSLSLLKTPSAAGLDVALQAAQVLAWKCRHQGGQLGAAAWPTLVQDLVGALRQLGEQPQARALATACCVALAAAAVAVPAWERPLSVLGAGAGWQAGEGVLSVCSGRRPTPQRPLPLPTPPAASRRAVENNALCSPLSPPPIRQGTSLKRTSCCS